MQIVATPVHEDGSTGKPAKITISPLMEATFQNAADRAGVTVYELSLSFFIPAEEPDFITEPTDEYKARAKRKTNEVPS